jgi:hypothetical protein
LIRPGGDAHFRALTDEFPAGAKKFPAQVTKNSLPRTGTKFEQFTAMH